MGTVLVGAVVLAIAVCAGISIYKDKKAGRCSGCSGPQRPEAQSPLDLEEV